MKRAGWVWGAVFVVALGVIAFLAASLKAQRRRAPAVASGRAGDAGEVCTVPAVVPVRALPGAESPPLLIWGVGSVRVFVDGAPAFSPPDAPKHFAVGVHDVRVEAPGVEPLKTRLRLDAFTPALLHAEQTADVGVTLVRLGSTCVSCAAPLEPVSLAFRQAAVPPGTLLRRAAESLARDHWVEAADALRGVPPAAREFEAFHRLAAVVLETGYQQHQAREELARLSPTQSHDLSSLVRALDALEHVESRRRAEVAMTRWNKVTEHFQALISRFGGEAPGPVHTASQRLGELSNGFSDAQRRESVFEQEKTLAAAEQALLDTLAQIRSSRPRDCDFQASVVSAVTR